MRYCYENLRAKLQTEEGRLFYENRKRLYEERYAGRPVKHLDYSKYKLIYKTGNRTEYDACFLDRMLRVPFLLILALGDDGYLEELENVIASICDEYTWVISAHAYAGNEGREEEFDYTRVDLFSPVQAMYLAEVDRVLGCKLSVSA